MEDFIRKVLSLPSRKDESSFFAAIESDMQKEERQEKRRQQLDRFQLIGELKKVLPLHLYGADGWPTWNNLAEEILSDRCSLEIGLNNELVRVLQICHVEFVSHKGEKLIETRQELLGGKIVKCRNRSGIYTKFFDDPTTCLASAIQSLGENVDCLLKRDGIKSNSYFYQEQIQDADEFIGLTDRTNEIKESESYPGLLTRYNTWHYSIKIAEEDYLPKYQLKAYQPSRRYFFDWQ
jgi:hypothetical protein